MPDTFELEIATPERFLLRERATEAQIPAGNGYIGVLPDHSPLLAELGIGEMTFTVGGRTRSLSIDGGWVEVLPDRVRVLANMAEMAEEIDVLRAEEELHRAEDLIKNPDAGVDMARALNAMQRAKSKLTTASHK
jgi:F-type H+-transporting ATPase subunit epsilon